MVTKLVKTSLNCFSVQLGVNLSLAAILLGLRGEGRCAINPIKV